MKRTFAIMAASGAIGLAGEALAGGVSAAPRALVFEVADAAGAAQPLRVSDDGDDDGGWFWSNGGGSGSDDGNGGSDDSNDCNDDDPGCLTQGRGNAAPAGSIAPPKNGLFTDGTVPQVKSN